MSAQDTNKIAIISGFLAKKGKRGRWSNRYFCLTAMNLVYFESMEAKVDKFSVSVAEIVSVDLLSNDSTRLCFTIDCGSKTMVLKCKSTMECSSWLSALRGILERKMDSGALYSEEEVLDVARNMVAALRVNSTFRGEVAINWLMKNEELGKEEAAVLGNLMVKYKLLAPTQSMQLDFINGNFRVAIKLCKLLPAFNTSENKKLQALSATFSNENFDVEKYVSTYFNTSHHLAVHKRCSELQEQRRLTANELQNEVYKNFTSLIKTANVFQSMENNIHELRGVVDRTENIMTAFQQESKKTLAVNIPDPIDNNNQNEELDEFLLQVEYIDGLEVLIYEQNYTKVLQVLESITKLRDKPKMSSIVAKAGQLEKKLVQDIIEKLRKMMKNPEFSPIDTDMFQVLVQLQKAGVASDVFLDWYSRKIVHSIKSVVACGDAVLFVSKTSKAIVSGLLQASDYYQKIFSTRTSSLMAKMLIWLSNQLSTYANMIALQIFPDFSHSHEESFGKLSYYKETGKRIASQLRHVFYNARQLELVGLPISHGLCGALEPGIQSYIASYMATMEKIFNREMDTKLKQQSNDRTDGRSSIHENKKATRSHSQISLELVQCSLREISNLLNPAFGTSKSGKLTTKLLLHYDNFLVKVITHVADGLFLYDESALNMVIQLYVDIKAILVDAAQHIKDGLQKLCCGVVSYQQDATSIWFKEATSAFENAKIKFIDQIAKYMIENVILWHPLRLLNDSIETPTSAPVSYCSILPLVQLQTWSPSLLDALAHEGDLYPRLVSAFFARLIEHPGWEKAHVGLGSLHFLIGEIQYILTSLIKHNIMTTAIQQQIAKFKNQIFANYQQNHDTTNISCNVIPEEWVLKFVNSCETCNFANIRAQNQE